MFISLMQVYWKEAIAYRAQYLVSLIVTPLRLFVMVMIWGAVYGNHDGLIGQYSLNSLITYFIVTSFIFITTYDDIGEELGKLVKNGNFLIYRLMPMHFMFFTFIQKCGRRFFALFAEIIPLIVIVLAFFSDYLVRGHYILFTLSLSLAFVLSYILYFIVGTMAFWIVDVKSIKWLINFIVNIASGLFVPIDLFPPMIATIFSYLPFSHIVFTPVNIYLGNYTDPWSMIGIQALWCGMAFLFARFFWKIAMRKFSGVGA